MAFSGRSSNVFRSPSTSPVGKNRSRMESSPNHNVSRLRLQVTAGGQNSALEGTNRPSPLIGSGSRPMDISPTVEENVNYLAEEKNDTFNAPLNGINAINFCVVKKKLEFEILPKILEQLTVRVNLNSRRLPKILEPTVRVRIWFSMVLMSFPLNPIVEILNQLTRWP